MVDSFDFSDTETDFKRLKGENNVRTSPPSSQSSHNYNSTRNGYNINNQHHTTSSSTTTTNTSFYNENRNDHRSNYLGTKKPFKFSTNFASTTPNYRKSHPFRTSFSKNYKNEAKVILPKFTDFKPYKGRTFDAQGYRDPKYFDSSKRTCRNISRTFINNRSRNTEFKENFHKITPSPTKEQVKVLTPPEREISSVSKEYKDDDLMDSSYFQIKTIDSYKEFCKIKLKGTIEMKTIYEKILFLKSITRKSHIKPVLLFFNQVERVFYGAAVVSLDEISEKAQIDTNTLESLIFRLYWIFLSEVEEETMKFEPRELKDSTVNTRTFT